MLSIIGIKKTIKQHTADMDITDSGPVFQCRVNFGVYKQRLNFNPIFNLVCVFQCLVTG
jgi:hypothetical protein